jgi:thiol-disulfide isomerase/thioredoxin
VVLLVVAPLAGWAAESMAKGEEFYDFDLETLQGEPVRIHQTLGEKATVVLFWASWSPRSAEALADYQALYKEHAARGLRVVAVNVEHEEWDPAETDKVRGFADAAGAIYPVVLDKDLTLFATTGFTSVPSSILVDGGRKVEGILQGYPTTQRVDFRNEVLRTIGVLPEEGGQRVEQGSSYVPRGKAAMYLKMGQVYVAKGKRQHGLNLLTKAVAEDPEYREAYRALVAALASSGRMEEAEQVRAALARLEQSPCDEVADGQGTITLAKASIPCP